MTMKKERTIKSLLLNTGDDYKLIFIRLIVGSVFILEGVLKFLFLEVYGPSFFDEIGFRNAFFWAYFTGTFEISCGTLVVFGLLTRLASIPLMIIMITAFITTKLPLLASKGFWAFAHQYTTDFSLTVLLIVLIMFGGGKWSLDLKISSSG
jgi:uncharacterized membrane protein YphA (DoxX/SURF4 family)